MTKRERGSGLSSLLCVVLWLIVFLCLSVLWLTGESSASGSEASQVSSGNRDPRAVRLPHGMDPMDVVHLVQRNKADAVREMSTPEAVEEGARSDHAETQGEAGAAFRIGGPGSAPDRQAYPAVAFDGTNYLVVWQDRRSGRNYDIYGTRVSIEGGVLDPAGIAISTADSTQTYPAVVFDGTDYLVVWDDYRSKSGWDIYGARVSVGGSVLDPSGIAISTATGAQQFPVVAFDGSNCLVVWQDYRSGTELDVYGARVSVGGSVLDPSGIGICIGQNYQYAPAVAFDGTDYLVVWQDYRSGNNYDIYGARVTVGGSVLDPAGIPVSRLSSFQSAPAVAFDGTNCLVVWQDIRGQVNYDIYGARVSVGGVVLDGLGIPISTAEGAQLYATIAFDGANYLVAWEDYRSGSSYDTYAARVSTSGGVLDPQGIAVSTATLGQSYPAVAFGGTCYLVVWEDIRGGVFSDICGARVAANGVVLDPSGMAVSTQQVSDEESPAVAFDGMNYLVVWGDYRTGTSYDLYGARVDAGGSVLDPTGIAISTAASNQDYPAIAFDGTNYLVVWDDYRSGSTYDIYGARVSVQGSVLDPSGIAISTATNDQYTPAVAFDGTNYFVAWTDYRGGYPDVYGTRVTKGGSVLDPSGVAISTAANDQDYPDVAFGGANYLVVWHDNRSLSNYEIYGARVSTGGTVLDAAGINISAASGNQYYPAVAFDGTNYLVVWHDRRSGTNWDIYGARVSVGGSVLDASGIAVCASASNQYYPGVAFDGTNYRVVWEDNRVAASWGIYGTRVSTAGVVLDFDGVAISPAGGDMEWPCAGKGPTGQIFVGYQCFTAENYNCYLIWGNLWGGYVGVDNVTEAPSASRICQSYPNPFNPACTIRYEVAISGRASLRVFDVRGSVVRTLVDDWREPGVYSEVWDGTRQDGCQLPSGVYFCRLEAGRVSATRKIVLLK